MTILHAKPTQGRPYTLRFMRVWPYIFALSGLWLTACGGGSSTSNSSLTSQNSSAASIGTSSRATASASTGNNTSLASSSLSGMTVGLDAKPSNTTCLAPPTIQTGVTLSISWQAAFPALPKIARPSTLFQLPGDNTSWYVLQQDGLILRFSHQPTASSTTEVLNINDHVEFAGNETGLLGAVAHPQFMSNRYLFLYYTGKNAAGDLETRVARYTQNTNGTFDRQSELILLTIDRPFSNHVGGQLAFDKDGYLYIASGDGGSGGDPLQMGQNLGELLGKILRIDVNTPSAAGNYSIPPTNPFINTSGARPEIWAYGLRNPWRFSFDKQTNDLWVGDVGQSAWEEVNLVTRGGNYGWGDMEGNGCYSGRSTCSTANKIKPLHIINQSTGACSVIGGYVYRGAAYPAVQGTYFFTDYCLNSMQSITRSSGSNLKLQTHGTGAANTVSFAQDNQGELYTIGQGGAGEQIYKMQATGATAQPGVMSNRLSDSGCVDSSNPQLPASGMIPYNVQNAFWADGAAKERYLSLPNDTVIKVSNSGDFDFPVGSVLMKHFKLGNKWIETRLFAHGELGWQGFSYEWLDDQSDAILLTDAKDKITSGINWHFPSAGQCLNCHTEAAGFTLGTEALQLNGNFTYAASGRTANQLVTFEHLGLFANGLTTPHKTDKLFALNNTQASLSQRARSYLHSNCSHCHQPGGPTPVNIDLRYTTALADTHTCNITPTAGDLGITNARILAPTEPSRSVLLKRMQASDNTQMPPLGHSVIDTEAVQVISAWISNLSQCN